MVEAVKIWNEPNNLSHWDFTIDSQWEIFSAMTRFSSELIKKRCPDLPLVLGGVSPIDARFINLLKGRGVLENLDIVGVHGFPLDWNPWRIDEWPQKIEEIENVVNLPVWVTEAGVSSFGADEVQVFGIKRTAELLLDRVDRVFWYSLMDLPPQWQATTRHKESEGSNYYRHFYQGLIRADGSPKPSMKHFDPRMGICQWFSFEDPRLDEAVNWLKKLGVKKLRTGISWADWHRPNAVDWFDRQMEALQDFDLTVTLCFTPPSRGIRECHTSPPVDYEEFGWFAMEVLERYILPERQSGQGAIPQTAGVKRNSTGQKA
ncbi:MAG: beta-xylosidase [Chitinivibrionales bacterium]